MKTALLELPYSELFSLIGIISVVCSIVGSAGMLWLSTKFVKKKAYYFDRDMILEKGEGRDKRLIAIERDIALSKEPLTNMKKSVDEMGDQLKMLTATITAMKDSVGNAIHAIDKRTVVLESRGRNRSRGAGGR